MGRLPCTSCATWATRQGSLGPPMSLLDGVAKGVLFRGSYPRFAVAPGRHIVLAHWSRLLSAIPEVAVDSDFEAGKTCYFVVSNDTTVGAVRSSSGRTCALRILVPVTIW